MSLNTQRCPQCEALQNDRDMWHAAAQTARSQCAALRALLHEARPLLKGRLADDPSHGDPSLLDRIAAALDP